MSKQMKFAETRNDDSEVMLTKKEKLGIIGESVVKSAISSVCSELGLRLVHSGAKSYRKGRNDERHDVDFKVYLGSRLLKVEELKNWRTPDGYKYSQSVAKEECYSRVYEYACPRGLIITNMSVFDGSAQQYLESEFQSIIETGKLLGKKDFKSKTYFYLKQQIHDDLKATLQAHIERKNKNKEVPLYFYDGTTIKPYDPNTTKSIEPAAESFCYSDVNNKEESVVVDSTEDNRVKQTPHTPVNNAIDNRKLHDEPDEIWLRNEVEKWKKLGKFIGFED